MDGGNRGLGFFVVRMAFLDTVPTDHGLIEETHGLAGIGTLTINLDIPRIGIAVERQLEKVELDFITAESRAGLANLPEGVNVPGIDLQQFQAGLDPGIP